MLEVCSADCQMYSSKDSGCVYIGVYAAGRYVVCIRVKVVMFEFAYYTQTPGTRHRLRLRPTIISLVTRGPCSFIYLVMQARWRSFPL
jgi:hypothetical protein